MTVKRPLVFDLDETLYRDPDLGAELSRNTRSFLRRELGLSDEELRFVYDRLPDAYPNPYDGLRALGLDVESYLETVFGPPSIEEYVTPDPALRERLAAVEAPVYVVSFSPTYHIEAVLDALGVSPFVDEYFSVFRDSPTTKKRDVYERLGCPDAVAIGDSYETDLRPALELGWDHVHVTEDCDVQEPHPCQPTAASAIDLVEGT